MPIVFTVSSVFWQINISSRGRKLVLAFIIGHIYAQTRIVPHCFTNVERIGLNKNLRGFGTSEVGS